MADETGDITFKTLPAVVDAEIVATLATKNAFVVTTKELILNSLRRVSALTDTAGAATLALLRDAKLIDKDGTTEPHFYNVTSGKLNLNARIVVPNLATEKFADTVQ